MYFVNEKWVRTIVHLYGRGGAYELPLESANQKQLERLFKMKHPAIGKKEVKKKKDEQPDK